MHFFKDFFSKKELRNTIIIVMAVSLSVILFTLRVATIFRLTEDSVAEEPVVKINKICAQNDNNFEILLVEYREELAELAEERMAELEELAKKHQEEREKIARKKRVEQAETEVCKDLLFVQETLDQITETSFQEGYSEMRGQAVLKIYFSGVELEKYPELKVLSEYHDELKERLARYDSAVVGAMEKLESMDDITNKMDVSKTLGLTSDELYQILLNAKSDNGTLLVPDGMARDIADGVVETVQEYPINEVFAVAVMALETGHFRSNACEKLNNFGGLTSSNGLMSFDSDLDGVKAAVKCIYKNMQRNGCTASQINKTYSESNTWDVKVLSVMRDYSSTRIPWGE